MTIFQYARILPEGGGAPAIRYLASPLAEFSRDKFVLLTGPRQVGKTTLAKSWLAGQGRYFNWDILDDRAELLRKGFVSQVGAGKVVLDEIHKYACWKNWLKGLYDGRHETVQAVVTESARLDVFQRGGDSMFGRYERLRIHPLSLGAIGKNARWILSSPLEENPSPYLNANFRIRRPHRIWKSWRTCSSLRRCRAFNWSGRKGSMCG